MPGFRLVSLLLNAPLPLPSLVLPFSRKFVMVVLFVEPLVAVTPLVCAKAVLTNRLPTCCMILSVAAVVDSVTSKEITPSVVFIMPDDEFLQRT